MAIGGRHLVCRECGWSLMAEDEAGHDLAKDFAGSCPQCQASVPVDRVSLYQKYVLQLGTLRGEPRDRLDALLASDDHNRQQALVGFMESIL